jgi:NDP-sugar pyrophosphorylase family protein
MKGLNISNKRALSLQAIILCAGEGTRLGAITEKLPKPLLRIQSLGNKTILYYIIKFLIQAHIRNLAIITGHLGQKIKDYIARLLKKKWIKNANIQMIDSEGQYKRGPLYSFLSLQNNEKVFQKKRIFIIFPGDTIFSPIYYQKIREFLLQNKELIVRYPVIFYRKVSKIHLLKEYGSQEEKIISTCHIKPSHQYLEKIDTIKLTELDRKEKINQIFPCFVLSYHSIKKIRYISRSSQGNSIKAIINHMAQKGYKIYAIQLQESFHFIDIDRPKDLQNIKLEFLKS